MTEVEHSAPQALIEAALRGLQSSTPPVQAPATPEAVLQARYGPYHEAAAVLSTFDRAALRPTPGEPGGTTPAEDGIEAVLADSRLVIDDYGRPRWSLLVDVRRQILRQLGNREHVEAVLAAQTAGRPDDMAQRMFEAYLRGTAPPLYEQDAWQVTGTLQVVEWLGGLDLVDDIPDRDTVVARSELLGLLQQFYDLAGTHFAGRQAELATLRQYVGVLPPGSVRERINRIAEAIFNIREKPPLVIYGLGGVGKSTLVARFIWEHATLPVAEQFPWAYIDFDRPGLLAEEPRTLLIEVVRQLGIQYPQARAYCDRIRQDWQTQLERRPPLVKIAMKAAMLRNVRLGTSIEVTEMTSPQEWERVLRDFASLLGHLKVETDPFLLVLDTFEQVQYRSDVVVAHLCEFLAVFQRHVPRLRTVLSGRAPLREVSDFPTNELELLDFDPEAAQAYLEAHGVSPPTLARSIAAQVGGSPLSLRLAVEVWRKEGGTRYQVSDLRTHSLLGFRVQGNEIQGQLLVRILNHIHDPAVRKLAYPGLVLRRITPALIREVLAAPCGVVVNDQAEAQRLFDEMRREVGLVVVEDGALRHRPDVRRSMVRLLRESEPAKVRQIEEAAVAYYARQDGTIDRPEELYRQRAEEIYHRLSLQQPSEAIEPRWIRGVEPYLFGALDELNIRERAWLAPRLGRTLTSEERSLADLEGWERDTARRARELLQHSQVQEALAALHERPERTPGSTIYALEAEAYERQGAWAEARRVVDAGLASMSKSRNRDLAVDLLVRGARAEFSLGAHGAAYTRLEEAEALLASGGSALRRVEVTLHRLALYGAKSAPPTAEPARQVLHAQFGALSDDEVATRPALMGWLAAELAAGYPEVLPRVVRLNGLTTKQPGHLRALALTLARWDADLSGAARAVPGVLARAAGAALAGTLTETWTRFVLETPPTALASAVAGVLEAFPDAPTEVRTVLAVLLRARVDDLYGPGFPPAVRGDDRSDPGGEPTRTAEPILGVLAPDTARTATLPRLRGPQIHAFRQALLDAFPSLGALAQMLQFRLGRNLDSLVLSDNMEMAVYRLIAAAEAEGWSAALLAAARESRPVNAALHAFAQQFGLAAAAPASGELGRVLSESHSVLDVAAWRARLGHIEVQVCRVEVSTAGTLRYGTGFLVGPDLVLTAYHVLEETIKGAVPPAHVAFRFDHKRLSTGETIVAGTVYHLVPQNWLVDYSEPDVVGLQAESAGGRPRPDQLDYALLRLADSPGSQPVGGDRAEPDAAPRRWIEVPDSPSAFSPGTALYIAQYSREALLLVAIDPQDVIGLNANSTRLLYRADAVAGSSGAPCFNDRWELVALQSGAYRDGRRTVIYGVPMAAIVALLQQRGHDWLLRQALA